MTRLRKLSAVQRETLLVIVGVTTVFVGVLVTASIAALLEAIF